MAYSKVVSSLLITRTSSLISCVQINAAVINVQNPTRMHKSSQPVLLASCFVLCSVVTVSSSSTSSSDHLYASANFFFTFSEDLDIFSSDKLQASTVYSLQEKWRGRNDARIAIMRMFISGYNRIPNHLNTLRVDVRIFVSAKKYLRKKNFPDTCGHGLSFLKNFLAF